MDEQAAPSTAMVEAPQSVELPASGTSEYAQWRATGELPEKPQPKKAAPAAADERTSDSSAPEAEPQQEKPKPRRKPDAEARIKALTDEIKALRGQMERGRPTQTQAESSPARPQQQPGPRNKPTPEDKTPDGRPKYSSYEDYVEDLADWKAEQRFAAHQREQQAQAQRQQLKSQLEEARERYPNYDAVAAPLIGELLKPEIPQEVFRLINDSPVLADLIYVIGGSDESRTNFLNAARSNPTKAQRVAIMIEQDIQAKLAKGSDAGTERNERGRFAAVPKGDGEPIPAKRGPEDTPAPPIEIGHRGGGTMDEAERALKAIERGDENAVRAWLRAENAKDLRRRRGV